MNLSSPPPSVIRLDAHVHIIGDGSAGSGCWLKLTKPYHRLLAQLIVRDMGLPTSALQANLDTLYAERLVTMIRESSIDAAMILAHEHVYDDNGERQESLGSFYTPNGYVLSLAEQYPEYFIPAVAIHPARADALDELERCIERGAAMLKLLPNCQNVDCSNKKFTKFWQRLADARMPFLAHTGGELSVPVINPKFANPRSLTHPLECGVTVIAAHCGTRSLLWDPNYTTDLIKMFAEFPNLYGDNSALNTPFRSAHFSELLSDTAQARIVHGSDLPIPISGFWNFLRGKVRWSDYRYAHQTDNLIERDARIKTALGFKEATFTRLLSLLPLSVQNRFSAA